MRRGIIYRGNMGKILIGTCGYHYNEWIGPVYPEGTKKEDFLGLYAKKFPTLELDYTYYAMPKAEQLKGMMEAGGAALSFSIKAHMSLTHKVDPHKWQDEAKTYLAAIEPVMEAGRLEAVLFQFPNSFHYTDENRRYLDKLLMEFSKTPSAVEFRNGEWGNNRVIDGLKKREVAFVSTDLPELRGLPPVLDVHSSPLAYFRLHGRNAENWWGSDSRSRYDYLYSETELERITERLKLILLKAERLLVYFNNHARGQAVKNAEKLKDLFT